MPRPLPLVASALAVLVGLVGCSGPAPESPASEASSSGAPASGASSSASSSEGGTDGAGSYSSQQLADLLGTVTDAEGAPLRIVPAAQIDQGMEQAQQFLDAVTITPGECEVFVSNSLDVPDGAGYATGVSGTEGDAIQTIVSVASSADAAFGQDRRAAAEEALTTCASFTVEAQGVEIDQTVEALDAVTGADGTYGTVTRQTSSDGAVQQTMTVTGSNGELSVTVVRTARDEVPAGTQAQLEDLVDATFAAVD